MRPMQSSQEQMLRLSSLQAVCELKQPLHGSERIETCIEYENLASEKAPSLVKAHHNVPSYGGDTVESYGEANPHMTHSSSYLRESSQNSIVGPLSSYLPTQIAFNPFAHYSVQASISMPAASNFSRYPTTDAKFLHCPSYTPPPSMYPATLPPMSLLPPALSTILLSSACDEGFRALLLLPMAPPKPLALQMLLALTAAPRSAI